MRSVVIAMSGPRSPQPANDRQVLFRGVAPPHPLQNPIGTTLQRQMDVGRQAFEFSMRADQGLLERKSGVGSCSEFAAAPRPH